MLKSRWRFQLSNEIHENEIIRNIIDENMGNDSLTLDRNNLVVMVDKVMFKVVHKG